MKLQLFRCFGAMAALLMMSGMQAAPLTWTLQDVVFDDGGTASGSFVFDADTGTYESIAITTTPSVGAGLFPTESFYTDVSNFLGEPIPGSNFLWRADNLGGDLTGVSGILLDWFPGVLTNAGGTFLLDLAFNSETKCANPDCSLSAGGRQPISGSITAIPIPAAAWLFAGGLGLLGWVRRRRTA